MQGYDARIPENTLVIFPNPSTGKGTIQYSLKNSSHVEITVVDLIGRQVAKPVDERKPGGTFLYEWDFGNLPEGIYLFILRSESGTCTTRCILTR